LEALHGLLECRGGLGRGRVRQLTAKLRQALGAGGGRRLHRGPQVWVLAGAAGGRPQGLFVPRQRDVQALADAGVDQPVGLLQAGLGHRQLCLRLVGVGPCRGDAHLLHGALDRIQRVAGQRVAGRSDRRARPHDHHGEQRHDAGRGARQPGGEPPAPRAAGGRRVRVGGRHVAHDELAIPAGMAVAVDRRALAVDLEGSQARDARPAGLAVAGPAVAVGRRRAQLGGELL
jgi:hypothetical protein